MKRSLVNEILADSDSFFRSFGFHLPPFAFWTANEMRERKTPAIIERCLGWDITDYGLNRFADTGLVLFTLRNGEAQALAAGAGMVYAEKIMISRKDQLSPMHHHIVKTEDIINRGGGKLVLELFNREGDANIDQHSDVQIVSDGRLLTLPAGGLLKLDPGESVTLPPHVWHAFWAEGDDVLIGEVSTVNDDQTDNVFRDDIGRFSTIEEDCEPTHLLVSDYAKWLA